MGKDSLGDRMKRYEDIGRSFIMPRMPAIIRVDGKAFHTLTRGCERPFDSRIIAAMDNTAIALMKGIQNARLAFIQSDEISILLNDYATYETQQWFGGNINKMVSISAAVASTTFTKEWGETGLFDSRVFVLPQHEVANYFIWRQKDWERNSLQMLARSLYSQKQLHGKNCSDLHELLHQKGVNWNNIEPSLKRGRCVLVTNPNEVDNNIPIFTQEREYIERFLKEDALKPEPERG